MNPILQAILIAAGGGCLVKLFEFAWDHYRRRYDAFSSLRIAEAQAEADRDVAQIEDYAKLRRELWNAVHKNEAKIEVLERALDDWRNRYFDLFGKYKTLEIENTELKHQNLRTSEELHSLKAEHQALKVEHERLQEEVTELRHASIGLKLSEGNGTRDSTG